MNSNAAENGAVLEGPSWLAQELAEVVRELAGYERPSASQGERRAAEWIAGRLRQLGLTATVEIERAHGGYWWPLGLLNGSVALAGFAARRTHARWARLLAAGLGVGAGAAIWGEGGGGGGGGP